MILLSVTQDDDRIVGDTKDAVDDHLRYLCNGQYSAECRTGTYDDQDRTCGQCAVPERVEHRFHIQLSVNEEADQECVYDTNCRSLCRCTETTVNTAKDDQRCKQRPYRLL